jgi:tetratricopeptide (TPR) repeat protein
LKRKLLAAVALLWVPAAQAQIVVSEGTGPGHACFLRARSGVGLQEGVETCSLAIRQGMMDISDLAATYDNRGVILDQLGRWDEADADFLKAAALRPDLGDAYVNHGAVLIRRMEYAQALEAISRGIALGPSFLYAAYYDRALALQRLGRDQEAYDDLRKALALEPNFAQASEALKLFTVVRVPMGKKD